MSNDLTVILRTECWTWGHSVDVMTCPRPHSACEHVWWEWAGWFFYNMFFLGNPGICNLSDLPWHRPWSWPGAWRWGMHLGGQVSLFHVFLGKHEKVSWFSAWLTVKFGYVPHLWINPNLLVTSLGMNLVRSNQVTWGYSQHGNKSANMTKLI